MTTRLLDEWRPVGAPPAPETASFDVAVIGDNTIDRFVDEPALGDLVGGNALNVAVQLRMLGLEVRYFGSVGDDADAGIVRRAIAARGLDTEAVRTERGATALTCIRRTAEGDRYFESESFGVTADYEPSATELTAIASARWVHIGMLPSADAVRARLAERNAAQPISQDCSVAPGLGRLSVAFMSAGEDETLAERLTTQALEGGVRTAVATLGSRGALARRSDVRRRVAGGSVDVVDTTGAGDSFMAGFIAAALRGGDLTAATEAGVQRGGFTCRYVGGWPQLPADVATFG